MAHIILGMTGSIALEKALGLFPLLKRQGHTIDVVLTDGALHFTTVEKVKKLIGKNPYWNQWDASLDTMHHITLASANLLVVVPATANTIAKIAHGIADNLLTTLALSIKTSTLIVPAMNPTMYANPATQENIRKLQQRGSTVLKPTVGSVACGDFGEGRMQEIEIIAQMIETILKDSSQQSEGRGQKKDTSLTSDFSQLTSPLKNRKILITAGGTRESIDPVRFIGNASTGSMGIALAEEATKQGAQVTLILANVDYKSSSLLVNTANFSGRILILQVTSTNDLLKVLKKEFPKHDTLIMAAAVADYTPVVKHNEKMKKMKHEGVTITLKQTPDLLKEVAKWNAKLTRQKTVIGFAAETNDLRKNGSRKLHEKKLDYIVVNKVPEAFGEEGKIQGSILGNTNSIPLKNLSKHEVATTVIDLLIQR